MGWVPSALYGVYVTRKGWEYGVCVPGICSAGNNAPLL